MLLTLVIPFYGVEQYIQACLAPLAALPAELCEILLVDDCGTDVSLELAGAFCREHSNARILQRKQNGGLSAARNTGLDAAQGDMVFFLDSDDIPEPEGILSMAKAAREQNLDVVQGRFTFLDDATRRETPGPQNPETDILPGAELFTRENKTDTYEPMVWQCLYSRTFLEANRLRMHEGFLFEDEMFTTPALILAGRSRSLNVSLLKYRQRPGSIMSGFRNGTRWCECYLEVCRFLTAFNQEHPGAKEALSERIARIALSFGKNIPGYGIQGENRTAAIEFIHTHKEEIVSYTRMGKAPSLKAQAALFALSPELFIRAYERTAGHL